MTSSTQKTVLVGVTGCIAAYKSCDIVRRMQDAGFLVKVVMTQHATEFVGATTFRALTNEPVALDSFENPEAPIRHISLAKSADLFLIVPATANVIAKIAQGVADDLLTTTAVAFSGQLIIAPAMNVEMWNSDSVRDNIAILKNRGVEFVNPGQGYLACGDEGEGRLADTADIVGAVVDALEASEQLSGKSVVVTAGPTVEALDPVRFISNRSSGAMGFALAKVAAMRGANVTLIAGPVNLPTPRGVARIDVTSAQEMHDRALQTAKEADVFIAAAAVADFRGEQCAEQKIKKTIDDVLTIRLVKNSDIVSDVVAQESGRVENRLVTVCFAAETENLEENARLKLDAKGADYCVANDVSRSDIGFDSDQNEVLVFGRDSATHIEKSSKRAIASAILDIVCEKHKL